MSRREFIALLGSAAVAWPLAARAQQAERMRRIGVLSNLTEDDPESASPDAAFVQGLRQLNWIDGRNVQSNIAMRLPIPLAFAALQWNWRARAQRRPRLHKPGWRSRRPSTRRPARSDPGRSC
jgi:hypothetical protein